MFLRRFKGVYSRGICLKNPLKIIKVKIDKFGLTNLINFKTFYGVAVKIYINFNFRDICSNKFSSDYMSDGVTIGYYPIIIGWPPIIIENSM